MLKIEENFSQGDSLIHRLDPRIKILFGIGFSFFVALCHHFPSFLISGLMAVALLLLACLPVLKVVKRLLVVNGFIVFLWFILPWTTPGEAWYDLGPLVITREGLYLAATITAKSNIILIAFIEAAYSLKEAQYSR